MLREEVPVDLNNVLVIRVKVPAFDNSALLEELSRSLIVRILNVEAIKPKGVAIALPKIWNLEDRVEGRVIPDDRIQFVFENVFDLERILRKAPWFVNGWLVTLEKWIIKPPSDYLMKIPFWIRIKGIPSDFVNTETVESIGSGLGTVEGIKLGMNSDSNSLECVRARVWILIDQPLEFKKEIRFENGEVITVELVYEKLWKLCFRCNRLTHDQYHCPEQVREPSSISNLLNPLDENRNNRSEEGTASLSRKGTWRRKKNRTEIS